MVRAGAEHWLDVVILVIYKGAGWGKTLVGSYKDGDIYKGIGWSKTIIGSYKNGDIYSGTGWSKNCIGCYKGDSIYWGIGWSKDCVGETSGCEVARKVLCKVRTPGKTQFTGQCSPYLQNRPLNCLKSYPSCGSASSIYPRFAWLLNTKASSERHRKRRRSWFLSPFSTDG